MKNSPLVVLLLTLSLTSTPWAEDNHEHNEAPADTEISLAQQKMAGIKTEKVRTFSLGAAITAPGQAVLNAYRSSKITPRTAAQITQRHVQLGDQVKKGQILISLSSVEMSQAQGVLMENHLEWKRVKRLGRKTVSDKRYVAAHIAYQQAYAKVRAFGMSENQIQTLLKTGDASRATGEFQLLSLQDGTVISDDFVLGELIQPGRVLIQISDETRLWVEARLSPEEATNITLGAKAQIQVGSHTLQGRVTQARHSLDETTRTLAIHIEVDNRDERLHPGQFVSAVIESKQSLTGIVVPLEAVLRAADGDWQVFLEAAPGRFVAQEVEVLRTVGNKTLISGIEIGSTVVTAGAFFVQSEIAKSGFSVHNH
ncbi:MAG: efflux RND transporter periplasmic adaptor subunit [Gammaproteobacteria bacterium]|nr:efflux RND transporter periplasmic adaptor subunit [Gammaproteobacteria bacterium]